jgi:WD40 repeat protein
MKDLQNASSLRHNVRHWLLLILAFPALLLFQQCARSQGTPPLSSASLHMKRLETKDINPPNGTSFFSANFVPSTSLAVTSTGDGIGSIWDLNMMKEVHHYTGPGFIFENISFSNDGHSALTSGFKSNMHLWDLSTGKDIHNLPIADSPQLTTALSPDGTHGAFSHNHSIIHLWTLATGATEPSLHLSGNPVRVAFTDGGKGLAWVQDDAKVCRWNLDPKAKPTCKGLTMDDLAVHATFSKDGTRLLIGGRDRTLILWDVATATAVHTWNTKATEIDTIALSPDGNFALWSGSSPLVHLWNLKTGQQVASTKGSGTDGATVAFSDDGSLALLGCSDGRLKLWALK